MQIGSSAAVRQGSIAGSNGIRRRRERNEIPVRAVVGETAETLIHFSVDELEIGAREVKRVARARGVKMNVDRRIRDALSQRRSGGAFEEPRIAVARAIAQTTATRLIERGGGDDDVVASAVDVCEPYCAAGGDAGGVQDTGCRICRRIVAPSDRSRSQWRRAEESHSPNKCQRRDRVFH